MAAEDRRRGFAWTADLTDTLARGRPARRGRRAASPRAPRVGGRRVRADRTRPRERRCGERRGRPRAARSTARARPRRTTSRRVKACRDRVRPRDDRRREPRWATRLVYRRSGWKRRPHGVLGACASSPAARTCSGSTARRSRVPLEGGEASRAARVAVHGEVGGAARRCTNAEPPPSEREAGFRFQSLPAHRADQRNAIGPDAGASFTSALLRFRA